MRTRLLAHRSLTVVVVSAGMATCGDPHTHNPLKPSGASLSSVQITGPGSVAPGRSAQFAVLLTLSDGAGKTSASAVWSSNSTLLQVNSSGVANAGPQTGEAVISVAVPFGQGTVKSTREVLILPDGTYRLVGNIKDGEFPSASVAGARLDVTPGSASATTDHSGNYTLYGVPADASIHIARDGYQPIDQSVHLTGNATQNFLLSPTNLHLHLSGPYTFAVDAAPGCSGPGSLAEDLQHRSYLATVTQSGPQLLVSLTENRFKVLFGSGNLFFGTSGVGGATFFLGDFSLGSYYYGYYYPSVAERLPNGTILVVAGSVSATGEASGLSGKLNGTLSNWSSAFPNGSLLGACSSASHQFTLTAR